MTRHTSCSCSEWPPHTSSDKVQSTVLPAYYSIVVNTTVHTSTDCFAADYDSSLLSEPVDKIHYDFTCRPLCYIRCLQCDKFKSSPQCCRKWCAEALILWYCNQCQWQVLELHPLWAKILWHHNAKGMTQKPWKSKGLIVLTTAGLVIDYN